MTNIPETGRTSRITIRLIVIQILVFSLLLTLGVGVHAVRLATMSTK